MQEHLAAWCITCLGIDSIGQFVLNKYHQILFYFFKQCCAISGLLKQVKENHPQSKRNMAKCSCSVLP